MENCFLFIQHPCIYPSIPVGWAVGCLWPNQLSVAGILESVATLGGQEMTN